MSTVWKTKTKQKKLLYKKQNALNQKSDKTTSFEFVYVQV